MTRACASRAPALCPRIGADALPHDSFAARFPMCTELQAFGADPDNPTACLPVTVPGGCCDITGAIAPTKGGRNGAIFFSFLIFMGSMFAVRVRY